MAAPQPKSLSVAAELSVVILKKKIIPKHLMRKVAPFLKKTTYNSDVKVNIAILEFDQVDSQGISYGPGKTD